MNKKYNFLIFLLILLVFIIFWFLFFRKPAAQAQKSVLDEPAAIQTAAVPEPARTAQPVLSEKTSWTPLRPKEGIVLFSRPDSLTADEANVDPDIKYLRDTKIEKPTEEFDKLGVLGAGMLDKLIAAEHSDTPFSFGDGVYKYLAVFSHFSDHAQDVRFILLFDHNTGTLLRDSCFAVKDEVFHGPEKEFSVRSDEDNYLVIAGGDYYLRTVFSPKSIQLKGLLFKASAAGWQEAAVFEAFGVALKRSQMDLNTCRSL